MYLRFGRPVIPVFTPADQKFEIGKAWHVNEGNAARYAASYERMLALIGLMHKAGVPLVAGTDNWAGFSLHRELELYVKAGIPAPEVLRIATWNGARYSGSAAEAGSIEVGKRADLVLVDGDPSVNISDIRKLSLVLKAGVAYSPAEIFEAVGVRPFVAGAAIAAGP